MTMLVILLLASSCLAHTSSGCAATLSDLLALCDTGQYLDTRSCTCRNCTYTCPMNQIIRRLCSPVSDSVCGPFFEFRQQKTKKKKKTEEEATREDAGARPTISGQGRICPDNDGKIPLLANDVRLFTGKLFTNQLKDADNGMEVHSARGLFLALLISAAAAAAVMLVAAVGTIVFVRSRKKTLLRNIVASSSADYSRIAVSPDEEGTHPANRSVVHIESQLIWNSQRRRGQVASLLGRRYGGGGGGGGNDYVRECDQKVALATSDAVEYQNAFP